MLSWSHSKFSEFAIQIVSCLESIPYNSEMRPSYGMVFDSVEKKEAENQSESIQKGLPHLSVSPVRFDNSSGFIEAKIIEDFIETKFKYEIENKGDVTAVVSEDGFKTSVEIEPGEKKHHIITSKISRGPNNDAPLHEFIDMLEKNEEHAKITLKLVYRPQNNKNLFVKKTVTHMFGKNKVRLIEK